MFGLNLWLIAALTLVVFCVILSVRIINVPFRRSLSVTFLMAGLFCFGVVHGQNGTDSAPKAQIKALEAQKELLSAANRATALQAFHRSRHAQSLQGVIDQYESELNNGKAFRCDRDPVYTNRLRTILDSLPAE